MPPLPEQTRETLKHLEEGFRGETPYDYERASRDWQLPVRQLIEQALGDRLDRYRTSITPILDYIEKHTRFSKMTSVLPKTKKIELSSGRLIFKDEKGNSLIDPIDITDAMERMVEEAYERERERVRRRSRGDRRYGFRNTDGSGDFARRYRRVEDDDDDDDEGESRYRRTYRDRDEDAGDEEESGRGRPTDDELQAVIRNTQQATGNRQSSTPGSQPAAGSQPAPGSQPATRPTERPRSAAASLDIFRRALMQGKQEDDAESQRFHRELRADRHEILRSMLQETRDGHNITARIDPRIQQASKAEFDRAWSFLTYNDRVDELLRSDPPGDSGYKVNPFKELGWNHDTLRQLMQKADKGTLYSQEVMEALYNERYEAFKESLRKRGMPEAVVKLLDHDTTGWRRSKSQDLIPTFQKIKALERIFEDAAGDPLKLPDEVKDLYDHKDKIAELTQILGDYIAYSVRLVNLVNSMKYQEAPRGGISPTIRQESIEGEGSDEARERNRVVRALHQVFSQHVDMPKFDKGDGTFVFDDLNGRTATVKGEWFTRYLSPETAYKMAYEESLLAGADPDNPYRETINEGQALTNLNRLLQLGISASAAIPSNQPISAVIQQLESAGVTSWEGKRIHYSGNAREDAASLGRALRIGNLADLATGSGNKALINNLRRRFIRIGSVIDYREKKERQEKHEAEIVRRYSVKMNEADAEDVIAALRKIDGPRKFSDVQLQEFKKLLISGAAIGLPTAGGGVASHMVFENGVSVSISAVIPQWRGLGAGLGVSVPTRVSQSVKVSIDLGVGGGYVFGGGGGFVGLTGGVRFTKECRTVDIHAEVGGGVAFLPTVSPIVYAGAGIDWGKTQAKYEDNLQKAEIEHHIGELDAHRAEAYKMVRENPEKYPEFAAILDRIDAVREVTDHASKETLFLTCYDIFKDGLRSQAFDSTEKHGWRKLLPTGVGAGVAFIAAPPIIAPYIYAKWEISRRSVVFRTASDVQQTRDVGQDQINQAILKDYREKSGETAQMAASKEQEIKLDCEIIPDGKGSFMLRRKTQVQLIPHETPSKFADLQRALGVGTRIAIERYETSHGSDAENTGLIEVEPQAASGDMEIYIDPEVKDDCILVWRGGCLFISVKNDKQLFVQRDDTTYPFLERGGTETTRIAISGKPGASIDTIRRRSKWFLWKDPTHEWSEKPGLALRPEDEGRKPENFMDFNQYLRYWGNGRQDRLEPPREDNAGKQRAYETLCASVTLEAPATPIRPAVRDKITELADPKKPKSKKFLKEFMAVWTEGLDFSRPRTAKGRPQRNIKENWDANLPKAIEFLQKQLGKAITGVDLNPDELNLALFTFTIASFRDLTGKKPEAQKKAYLEDLENFEKYILTSAFTKYYKDQGETDPALTQHVEAAVRFILDHAKGIDITQPGAAIEAGTMFASFVGTDKITGLRLIYNYQQETQYGMVGRKDLSVKAEGPEREVAKFWLRMLSPYSSGAHRTSPRPKPNESGYQAFEDKIYSNLGSAMAVKLVPAISPYMTAAEMTQLTTIYQSRKSSGARTQITDANFGAVQKFLNACDKVREAELAGEPLEVKLNEEFSVIIDVKTSLGIYKKCGNVTGLLTENFGIKQKVPGEKPTIYVAAMSEGFVQAHPEDAVIIRTFVFGVTVPRVIEQEVRPEPKPKPPPVAGKPGSTATPAPRATLGGGAAHGVSSEGTGGSDQGGGGGAS